MSAQKALILARKIQEEGQRYLLREIAGIPVVLRLILSAQKAGIEHFLILGMHQDIESEVKKILAQNGRLKASIEYGENLLSLREKKGENFLVMLSDSLPDCRLLQTLLTYPIAEGEVVRADGCFLCTPSLYPLLEGSADEMENRFYKTIKELTGQGKVKILEIKGFSVTLEKEESFKIAEKMLFDATGISPFPEGFLQKLINKRLSFFLTKWLISTSITPNQLTIISIFMGLLSAFLLSFSTHWANIFGAMVFQLCIIVDDSDGHIARLKFQQSRRGVLLDRCGDLAVDTSIFLGIAVGSYRKTGQSHFLWLGFLMALGIFLTFFPTFWEELIGRKESQSLAGEGNDSQKSIIAEFTDRDWSYLIILFAFLDRLEWFLWMAALGAVLFGLTIFFLRLRPPNDGMT